MSLIPKSHDHRQELREGKRFAFGDNWTRFLDHLDEGRIFAAQYTLTEMLGCKSLVGQRFLDAGSGSGLFSLAARRLGAEVFSFDYDPQSVACTNELRNRFAPDDALWTVQQGSVLDHDFLSDLGQSDIVYSWGVLHHTGEMHEALENISHLVKDGGKLFIAIYNDQGSRSKRWLRLKQAYNRLPASLRWLVLWPTTLRLWGPTTLRDFGRGHPFETWRNYAKTSRAMSPWRDVVDWVGGLPFEVAKPEDIFQIYRDRGFNLLQLKTCAGGHGCNEFVFQKIIGSEP